MAGSAFSGRSLGLAFSLPGGGRTGFVAVALLWTACVLAVPGALIEERAKTRRFPSVAEVEAVLAGSNIESKREAVRRVLLEVKVAAVGTRLKDEFHTDEWTADVPGPECYESSTALADRIETVWS